MATREDRLLELEQKYEEAMRELGERTTAFVAAAAGTQKQREKAEERLATQQTKVRKLETDLVELRHRVRIQQGEATVAEARKNLREVQLAALGDPRVSDAFEQTLAVQVDAILDTRAAATLLKEQDQELTELVRAAVEANPTGWRGGKFEGQYYVCWVSRDGRQVVTLVDNPLYGITTEQLVELVGTDRARQYLKVDYPAFEKAVAAGSVVRPDGTPVAVEDLEAIRSRTERTKRMLISRLGERDFSTEVSIIPPALHDLLIADLAELDVDRATLTALQESGLRTFGQIRSLSCEDLAGRIRGIGPKRARKVLDAVRRLAEQRVTDPARL